MLFCFVLKDKNQGLASKGRPFFITAPPSLPKGRRREEEKLKL
jgi:hypothetical protein